MEFTGLFLNSSSTHKYLFQISLYFHQFSSIFTFDVYFMTSNQRWLDVCEWKVNRQCLSLSPPPLSRSLSLFISLSLSPSPSFLSDSFGNLHYCRITVTIRYTKFDSIQLNTNMSFPLISMHSKMEALLLYVTNLRAI